MTLLDWETARTIGIEGPSITLSLRGIDGERPLEVISEKVTFTLDGKYGAFVLENITMVRKLSLPRQSITESLISLPHLRALEIDPYPSVTPTILIGQDYWDLIVTREIRSERKGLPVASKTLLGWVVHGRNGVISKNGNA